MEQKLYRPTKISTDISIDYGQLSTDISNGYLLTINQVSTNHRPSVDQLLTNTSVKYRPTISGKSAKCRWSIGERKAISAEIHLERLLTVSRPSVDRLWSESWPTIDCYIHWVSTDYWPLYRPIDRSTLPTVNMIRFSLQLRFFSEKPFYGNYSMLDSHTNTVISHLFAYSSRWHWKLWRGLLLQNTMVSDQNSWDTSTQSCL